MPEPEHRGPFVSCLIALLLLACAAMIVFALLGLLTT